MPRRRWVLALLALAGCSSAAPPPAPAPKPALALLTSLPILFGESFGLEPPKSALREALEEDYVLDAVDGPERLAPGGLLLAIQPQALTAERLVALDRWVRAGGRLVLLADPQLQWESSRPLGDKFRPPFVYPDTGLLAHWGLTLAPGSDPAGPGRLAATGSHCSLEAGGTVARCRIGSGAVTVLADADLAMSGEAADLKTVTDLLAHTR